MEITPELARIEQLARIEELENSKQKLIIFREEKMV
jgi:hypothetical protein